MKELLPCPHCGGEAKETLVGDWAEIECTQCGATMPSKGTWEQTKADWNQWVVPPKILRLVKIIIKDHCSNCILERAEYGEMRPSRCKKCFFNKAKEFTKEHTARKS